MRVLTLRELNRATLARDVDEAARLEAWLR